jgi:hypothetical protein
MEIVYPWIPAILQFVLAIHMLRRKLYHWFPFFLAYTLFSFVATAIRQAFIMHAPSYTLIYIIIYWGSEIVYGVLALGAISEAFKRIFFSYYRTFRLFRIVFPTVIFFIIAIAYYNAIKYPLPIYRIAALIYTVQLDIHWLQLGLLLFIALLVKVLNAKVRQYEFGLLSGFGVSSASIMVAYLLVYEFRTKHEILLRYISTVGYLVAVIVWLYFFMKPQPPRVKVAAVDVEKMAELMKAQLEAVDRMLSWSEILSWMRRLFWRRKDDS